MKLREDEITPCATELLLIPTGEWRSERPVLAPEKCNSCGQCWLICPVSCIHEGDSGFRIDFRFCKGCGMCAAECGFGAIHMEREQKE